MRSFASSITVVALAASVLTIAAPSGPAFGVDGSQFDPGFIISDQNFFNGGEMSAAEVQTFIASKSGTCRAGYTCLVDYRQATPAIAPDAYCDGYVSSPNERAADIIAKVGLSCNVSQKVLLVLLQKEQSLVTSTAPSTSRYNAATGYACPDTAVCNPSFSGFIYQVYYAARQYQRYATLPGNYNYRAGRVNNILFHPNAACGTAPVYIANQATAGLYNYTPYQPNGAALRNLYGTGDSCSSYGNRNFWRLYWDWFGSPVTDAILLRTTTNSRVYLVTGGVKYPVMSFDTYVNLLPLGGLGYVSQGYLDGFPTGTAVGSIFRNDSGKIAIFDRSTYFSFASCAQMVDFGSACDPANWVQLTDAQYATFAVGPQLTNVIGTLSGGRYIIAGGTRTELLDAQAQADAGYGPDFVVLSDAAIAALPLVAPRVRDNVFIRNRETGAYFALVGGLLHPVPAPDASALGLAALQAGSLTTASLALIPQSAEPFTSTVKDSAGNRYVLSAAGRYAVGTAGDAPALTVPDAILALFPDQGAVPDGLFVKSPDAKTVYLVEAGMLRAITSWAALVSIAPSGGPLITTLPSSLISSMPKGPGVLTSGALVRTVSSGAIYLVDGLDSKIKITTFSEPAALGIYGFSYVSDQDLATYTTASSPLGFGVECDGTQYVAATDARHAVPADLAASYPLSYLPLSSLLCASLTVGTDAGVNIRTPNGKIYRLDAAGKHAYSYERWLEIGILGGWMSVDQRFADQFATGSPA